MEVVTALFRKKRLRWNMYTPGSNTSVVLELFNFRGRGYVSKKELPHATKPDFVTSRTPWETSNIMSMLTLNTDDILRETVTVCRRLLVSERGDIWSVACFVPSLKGLPLLLCQYRQ